ncbi:MAG: SCO family protein [Steroidobacteraceae bacterium]
MNRSLIAAVVVAAALAGVAVSWLLTRADGAPPALEQATYFQAPRPLPAFALVDQSGKCFDRSRLAGRWTLLFFGFTHCPDVCPLTLATLADARRQLADLPRGEIPQVVLVSVDPRRDTPEALARYVAHFDPAFVGVTGDQAAIDQLARDLGVAVMIGPPAPDGSYTVDHTAAIFLIDPDAGYTAVFGTPHEADTIARDFRSIVAADAR